MFVFIFSPWWVSCPLLITLHVLMCYDYNSLWHNIRWAGERLTCLPENQRWQCQSMLGVNGTHTIRNWTSRGLLVTGSKWILWPLGLDQYASPAGVWMKFSFHHIQFYQSLINSMRLHIHMINPNRVINVNVNSDTTPFTKAEKLLSVGWRSTFIGAREEGSEAQPRAVLMRDNESINPYALPMRWLGDLKSPRSR